MPRSSLSFSLALLVAFGCTAGSRAAPSPAIPELAWEVARAGTDSAPVVAMRLTLPASADSLTTLRLPGEWAGDTALWREIESLRVVDGGARLVGPDSGRHRVVRRVPGEPVTVAWQVRPTWTFEPVAPGRHNRSAIARDWLQLVGHDVLVTPDVDDGDTVRARFTFRGSRAGEHVATSFGAGDTVVHVRAPLGEVVHAVYGMGAVRLHRFTVRERPVVVTMHGTMAIPDSALAGAVRRVMEAERGFWDDAGAPFYLVALAPAPPGTLAGSRLTNAFVAYLDHARPLDARVYTILAHELMHDWIGSQLQPAHDSLEYRLKWFTEGFTDFYARRTLHRAGVLSDSAYLESIAQALFDYRSSAWSALPFDTIAASYWRDPQAQRIPYLRGQLFALRADALARGTPGRRSLDDVMRALLRSGHGRAVPLTDSVLAVALAPALGPRSRDEIAHLIHAGAPLELPAGTFGPCVDESVERRALWRIGFDLEESIRTRTVTGVRAGEAAERAGLRDGMPIKGLSVHRGDVTRPVMVVVAEQGTERRISYPPVSADSVTVPVYRVRAGCDRPLP